MITLQTKKQWDMTRFFMHACAFLLLLEWLRPLIGIRYFFNIYCDLFHPLLFSNKVADSNKSLHDFIHHSFPIL